MITTGLLLTVLVGTRMMVGADSVPEFEIREVETVALPEPPPPPEQQDTPVHEPPPPPPALANLKLVMDVNQPALPVSRERVDPRIPVDTFFTDEPPAPLPSVAKPVAKPVSKPTIEPAPRPVMKAESVTAKSEYSLGELDQQPRLLRNPSVVFPSTIKDANSGRVVVRVAILPSGRCEFVAVVSTTHPELVPLAQRIASGSRFTPPTRQGEAVKAVMTWPITIKK